MVTKSHFRIITTATRNRVAELAAVANDSWMQDWPLEVADPDRVQLFLSLVEESEDDDDRFALMSLLLSSLDAAPQQERNSLWPRVTALLVGNPSLFMHEIIYWSCADEHGDGSVVLNPESECHFAITSLMREVLSGVAGMIGLVVL